MKGKMAADSSAALRRGEASVWKQIQNHLYDTTASALIEFRRNISNSSKNKLPGEDRERCFQSLLPSPVSCRDSRVGRSVGRFVVDKMDTISCALV